MLFVFIFVALALPCASMPVDGVHEVARFSASHGFQAVNIVFGHGREREVVNLMKTLSAMNILSKTLKLQNVLNQKNIKEEEKFIWMPQRQDMEDKSKLRFLQEILDKQSVKNSLWLLDFDFDWKKTYEDADLNAFFYIFSGQPMPTWLQLMSVHKVENPVIGELTFKAVNNERMVDEQYDLQNMTITSSTLDYNQESILGDCDSITLECWNPSGYYWDIVYALEDLINMTVVAYKEPSNNWGVLPEHPDGSQNVTNWIGVLGSVEKRNHQIGSALWVAYEERVAFFDFSLAWFRTDAIFFKQEKDLDNIFFLTRPFTVLAWEAVVLTSVAIMLLKHLKDHFQRNGHVVSSSARCIFISTNIFLLLLQAYYTGALTMFNVKQEGVPFTNLEEAIDAYPTWKFIVQKADLGFLAALMPRKTNALEELLHRIESNEVSSVITSLEQGLERVQETKSVMFSSALAVSQMKGLRATKAFKMISLRRSPLFFILGKNSPLTPSFQWGLLKLWESGHTRHIINSFLIQWKDNHKEKPSAITLEQVALAFLAMGVGILSSLLALLMERYGKLGLSARPTKLIY